MGDLAGGEVDRDVERPRVGALPVPLDDLAAGALLDPAPDRLDQAAVLGDRDELGRVEQAALGVLPADQRLEAGDLAGAQADHRLVVEGQLVAVERVAQLAFDLEPAQRPARISASNSTQRARPLFLGPVHGRVGVADQQLGVGRARFEGRATAIPMLALMKCSTPSIENGWAKAAATRSAIATASSSSARRSTRIPNSSPPKRATMSPGRRWARRRGATARSSSSPAWWPRLSLISLKWSRSRKRIPTGEPETVARFSASASESTKLSRLGSPVSESCRTRWRSAWSAVWRSIASARTLAAACRKGTSWG